MMSFPRRFAARALPKSNFVARPVSIVKIAGLSSAPSSPFSTKSPFEPCSHRIAPTPASRQASSSRIPSTTIRHASTSTSTSTPTSTPITAPHSSASPSTPEQAVLNWNEFLRLRRIRRYFNLGGSVTMGVTGLFTSAAALASEDIAGKGQQLTGLDPFVIMGAWTTGFFGLGWLLGPLVGTAMFGVFYRRFGAQMRVKERDFFERIRKYRVDPTSSSMQNPVPDYYGEKITSVAGYRRWLKDQRAFNKKRQSFV